MEWKGLRSLLCLQTHRRYVFIVTYGRSGSTLLMNIINSCKGCCIRGENGSALYGIYKSYSRLKEAKIGHGKNAQRPTSPWWGLQETDPESYGGRLVRVFIEEVIRPRAGDRVCGFKEIRFSDKEVPDLEEYLEFICRFFPGAKFVINHRDVSGVAKSKWWSMMPDALPMLIELDEKLNAFQDEEKFFHFSYDRALHDRTHVRELFGFLDLPYEANAVEEVFARRHSY